MEINANKASSILSKAIRIRTVSAQGGISQADVKPFQEFHRLLEESYPKIHGLLERKVINNCSLCYRWSGNDPDLESIAFLAHMDVVPVTSGEEKDWYYEPFSGEIADGFVWGRGTLDMKGTLMAIMEAVETLLGQGFTPERTIYLAFGHDEELGGKQGAQMIARYLKTKGVGLQYTLDEGMVILDPDSSPIKKTLGIIGIAEKGYVSVNIRAKGKGGHSSCPPPETVIGKLCKIAAKLEKRQMPTAFSKPVNLFFQSITPEMAFQKRILFEKRRMFGKLLLWILTKSENTNALIRTTTASTMIRGGSKENVLPTEAILCVNFRILQGDTVKKVVDHVKKNIADTSVDVEVSQTILAEPSPVAAIDSSGFKHIRETICKVFPDTVVTPGLVLGMTDSRHYAEITKNCYRFSPLIFAPDDLARVHGINERISLEGYFHAIRFFIQFIKNSKNNSN